MHQNIFFAHFLIELLNGNDSPVKKTAFPSGKG
jgi:hypothetical protein